MSSSELTGLFYQAFRMHAHGVALLTYRDARGQPRGMTATSVCSVSVTPPQLLACLDRHASARREITRAGAFGIALLTKRHRELARTCARPGLEKPIESWCVPGEVGPAPCVQGALAWFECEVAQVVECATHSVCVGRIRRIRVGESDEPLVYFLGQYHTAATLAPGLQRTRSYDELRDDMFAMYA